MRALMATSIAATFVAAAHANDLRYNCDVSYIHGFKPDGTPLQVTEKDMKAQYAVTIQNDAMRAELKSANRKEVVVYRVLMHNATDFIGAMSQTRPSDAAIAISKEPNPTYNMYPGGLTAAVGGSIKVTSLVCLKAP
jgi:hypothetical protein